jgi:hypothetical protein
LKEADKRVEPGSLRASAAPAALPPEPATGPAPQDEADEAAPRPRMRENDPPVSRTGVAQVAFPVRNPRRSDRRLSPDAQG